MYSETPDIVGFPVSKEEKFLTREQLNTLKNGTLQVLDEVGVRFPSRRALEIFEAHGARVDWKTEVVRIPPGLVEKAMSTAPRSFVLGGREERFDLVLDGKTTYLCTEGCGVHVIDLETRRKRASRKSDFEMIARVSDALPLVGFCWPVVSAQDHPLTAPLHECHAGLTNTLKHVRGATTVFSGLAKYIVEMATVVAGSEENRRRRPPICGNICTIPPLGHDGHGIESALTYAEAGIPFSFMAMPTMGSTAPMSLLGAVVVGDAEVVSGMVLVQLAFPGAPVFHSIMVSMMDMRTGGYISHVPAPIAEINVRLAHDAWNVPCLGSSGTTTDADELDWQAGCECGSGVASIGTLGEEICGYFSLTGGAMILYPEKLILDHEICLDVYHKLHRFNFSERGMALDIIEKVGPGGHFILEDHTLEHMRDFRLESVFWRRDTGGDSHLLDPRDVALEEFRRIERTHRPQPLPGEVLAELDRILAAADREAASLA